MADAIIPDYRAPEHPLDEGGRAQNTPTRDYSAEYARREEIARAEGFPTYWAKRKAQQDQGRRPGRRRRRAA